MIWRRRIIMKRSLLLLISLVFVVAVTGSAFAQFINGEPIPPPNASFAGTTDIGWDNTFLTNTPYFPKRVGIIAYCADIYHGAGDIGLQSNINNPNGPWAIYGPFTHLGNYGAQNLVDYFGYDDTIDRLRDAQIIDGDLVLPTAQQLIQNFDIVIAYTDNKCGPTLPTNIANSATSALTGFIGTAGKKLILTGFAFSSTLGFGNGIYANGLSPLTKGGPGLAACRRAAAGGPVCEIGTCPATSPNGSGNTCTSAGTPPECRDDVTGQVCTAFQPLPAGGDRACSELLRNVNGPTSSSWATALTQANVAKGATLCFNYDSPDITVPFIAINAARNIIAINSFPPDRDDIQKFWYGCMLGNAVQYFSGDTKRCVNLADPVNCHN
jgi:hypothetical protein